VKRASRFNKEHTLHLSLTWFTCVVKPLLQLIKMNANFQPLGVATAKPRSVNVIVSDDKCTHV